MIIIPVFEIFENKKTIVFCDWYKINKKNFKRFYTDGEMEKLGRE